MKFFLQLLAWLAFLTFFITSRGDLPYLAPILSEHQPNQIVHPTTKSYIERIINPHFSPSRINDSLSKQCYLNWSRHRTKSGSIPGIVCFCFGHDGIARADGGIDLFCLRFNQESPSLNVHKATISYSKDGQSLRKCLLTVPRHQMMLPQRKCSCETKDGKRTNHTDYDCRYHFEGISRLTFLYIR